MIQMMIGGLEITLALAIAAFFFTALITKGFAIFEPLFDFLSDQENRWWGGIAGWMFVWFLLVGTVVTAVVSFASLEGWVK